MSAVSSLPSTSDRSQWSEDESAMIEAAGLVYVDRDSKQKYLADRPTVAAFLAHCAKTGLDPIAKQIYCLPRKTKAGLKWTIQVSIDGARALAQRSREYEGQTTPEFTADGQTWTTVWLGGPNNPPAAARVGVHRRGFKEPLYVVALWEAYVQTDYNGGPTEMWRKMGPLMLAKCAEMLALRKAFPQDLSGLYVEEELMQADNAPAAQELEGGSSAPAAVGVQLAPEPAEPESPWSEEQIEAFLKQVAVETDMQALRGLYNEASAAGALAVKVDRMGTTIEFLITERRDRLQRGVPPQQGTITVEPEPESAPAELPLEESPSAAVKAAVRKGPGRGQR